MKINLSLIEKKRKEKDFNISQMASFLNLSDSSQYWKREKGHYKFKIEELPTLSEKLEIPFGELFLSDEYSKMEIKDKKEVC